MGRAGVLVGAAVAAFVALAGLAGCKVTGTFECAISAQCGAGGTCQPLTGFCSFADGTCPSGQRYDDYAGAGLAGSCVGDPNAPDAAAADADPGAPDSRTSEPDAAIPQPDAAPPLTIRINIGGAGYTGVDYPGVWSGDPSGTTCGDGDPYGIAANIQGTVDDPLFSVEYFHIPAMNCAIGSLPGGSYQVHLLWAELYYGCSGPNIPHVFTVSLEGILVDTLDSMVEGDGCAGTSGGHPFEGYYSVTVNDGQLDVRLTAVDTTQAGILSAIEVIKLPDTLQ
jgi:hypothetical protein